MSLSPSLTAPPGDAAPLPRMQRAERAAAALLPSDHPLGPERRRRVDATLPEMLDPGVAPLPCLLPAQLIGYHLAMAKFTAARIRSAEPGGDR